MKSKDLVGDERFELPTISV